MGTYAEAAQDHPWGASRCLWVLEVAPRECPDGLAGHFCRSVDWEKRAHGEGGREETEQYGQGEGQLGRAERKLAYVILLARQRAQARTNMYAWARSPWEPSRTAQTGLSLPRKSSHGSASRKGKQGVWVCCHQGMGWGWGRGKKRKLPSVLPVVCPEAQITVSHPLFQPP